MKVRNSQSDHSKIPDSLHALGNGLSQVTCLNEDAFETSRCFGQQPGIRQQEAPIEEMPIVLHLDALHKLPRLQYAAALNQLVEQGNLRDNHELVRERELCQKARNLIVTALVAHLLMLYAGKNRTLVDDLAVAIED